MKEILIVLFVGLLTVSNCKDTDLIDAVKNYLESNNLRHEAQEYEMNMLKAEARIAKIYSERRDAFSRESAFLGATPYSKQLSQAAEIQMEYLYKIKKKFDLNKKDMKKLMETLPSVLHHNHIKVHPDMPQQSPDMDTCPYPINNDENDCIVNSPYRTADGTCNNLHRPLWGKSHVALRRFLKPDYADGIGAPRVASNGKDLPSARKLSLNVFKDKDRPSHILTRLYMTFGQVLDHDMTRTAVTKLAGEPIGSGNMVDVSCGSSGCDTNGAENRACLPIDVPKNDPDFKGKECLKFVRTAVALNDDCSPGPREQLNQITSYLDASHVYGSTKEEMDNLRDLSNPSRGQMKVTPHPTYGFKPLLPQNDVKACRDVNSTIKCFAAGDGRVNEQVGLAAQHTMWVRYHNDLEEELHVVNPHWDGENLFQETRRILAAVWQHVVYKEYLPLTLGAKVMQKYRLNLQTKGYAKVYNKKINADCTNSFATAAFRFGHGMIDNDVVFAGPRYKEASRNELTEVMLRPVALYEVNTRANGTGIDGIMHGALSQPSQGADSFFAKQVTAKLFTENPPNAPGMDLAAINIQRGRDHGLPSYNKWRKWCKLRVARKFNDLKDIPKYQRRRLQKLYKNVNDIDLFAGAMLENIIPGATVGPTFACIIGRQFRNSKVGDRFWYETNNKVTRFTRRQLSEIRKMTLSSIICNSCDRLETIQRFALLQPLSQAIKKLRKNNYADPYSLAVLYRGDKNERRPCQDLPRLDLSAWQEKCD